MTRNYIKSLVVTYEKMTGFAFYIYQRVPRLFHKWGTGPQGTDVFWILAADYLITHTHSKVLQKRKQVQKVKASTRNMHSIACEWMSIAIEGCCCKISSTVHFKLSQISCMMRDTGYPREHSTNTCACAVRFWRRRYRLNDALFVAKIA